MSGETADTALVHGTGAEWEELVSAALLGTDRRTPPGLVPDTGGDTATALLDAAAVATVRRRAGLLPAAAAARPDPAAADSRAPLPRAAARRLAQLLDDRANGGPGSGARGIAPALAELLPQWLATANRHGYRAPASLVPALLGAARARTELRPHAVALAGPRGLWLAELNADWRFALRTAGRELVAEGADNPRVARQVWEEGLFTERAALLGRSRERDPAAGLALLRSTWSQERAEDRLLFLDSLRTGLGQDDEPFLEQALSDRSRNVRATAAELLTGLPGSALSRRMGGRALNCVSLDRTGVGPRVTVRAPADCDASMERDGVVATPPSGRGERAWWLGQLVEAAPLCTWPRRLGGRSAREIIALPVADGWQPDLHAAWCRAALRQRDEVWARALLGPPPKPATATSETAVAVSVGDPAKLLSVLPPEERAAWVADFVAVNGLSEGFQMLGACAVPWSGPLGRAVTDALDIARQAGSYPWSFSGVMGLAERCLDPAEADHLEPLAAVPPDSADGSPGAGGYWSEAFQRLVSTLRLRATMLAELTPPGEEAA